jgi:hypothetical protein
VVVVAGTEFLRACGGDGHYQPKEPPSTQIPPRLQTTRTRKNRQLSLSQLSQAKAIPTFSTQFFQVLLKNSFLEKYQNLKTG